MGRPVMDPRTDGKGPARQLGTGAPFTHLSVGTDGSAGATVAVRQAARLGRLLCARVDIVHVFDGDLPEVPATEALDPRLVEAEAVLDLAARIARDDGVDVTTRVLAGGRTPSLVHDAEECGADLIAVGADAGFFERLHLRRGVAAQAAREATCSVLVARQAGDASAFPTHILVATDGSDASREAVDRAAAIARATGAQLAVLHVVAVHGVYGVWTVATADDDPGLLEAAVRAARSEGIEATAMTDIGWPGEATVATATEIGADLIVVGSNASHGSARPRLGSVSEWIAGHAHASVLVVRL